MNVFVDIDGYLKPRFGYSGLAGLETNSISGSVTIAAGSTTATVAMPTTQATATYPIVFGVRPSASAPDVQVWFKNRTTLSFDVEISADPGMGNTVEIDWYIPSGKDTFGIATFGVGVTTVSVAFAVPQQQANYMLATGVGLGSGTPPGVFATVKAIATTGFDINISADPGAGNTIVVAWQLFFADLVPNTTAGSVLILINATTAAVVFAVAQPDTNYSVVLGVHRGVIGGVDQTIDELAVVRSATVNGFTIEISAAPNPERIAVDWRISRLVIASVGEPVLGGIGFYDKSGVIQYVIATQTKWFRLSKSPTISWVNITDPANPNTGSLDDQVRFVVFPYLADIWVLGVNNTDPMRAWHPGLSTYTTVTAAPICRDIEVIGSRVMAINTVEVGVRYSYRVRWSNVNDFTTWNALADQDLTDQGQPLVAVKRLGPTSAAIYGFEGVTIATDQPGLDATAFRFDEINPPNTPGPCGPSDVVSAVGLHFYKGIDARIYQFDGVSVVPISAAIDPVLQQAVSLGFASRSHAVYYPSLRQIWFFFVRTPDTEPRWATVYNVDAQRFEPLQELADFATTSFPAVETIGYTWLTWVSDTDTWMTIPWPTWASIPDSTVPIMVLGLSDGRVERFGFNSTDDGVAIPYTWFSSLQRVDPNNRQLPSAWDTFFQKQPLVGDQVTAALAVLGFPTAVPVAVQNGTVTWDVGIPTPIGYYPGANAPPSGFTLKFPFFSNVPPNEDVYAQMSLRGSTTARLVFFGGSEVFVYQERRA